MRTILLTLLICFAGSISAQIAIGPSPPAGEIGKAYSHQFQATGGTGGYTFWINSPSVAPAGLALNPATGVLSGTLGTPVSGDSFVFTVTVVDSTSQTASQVFTLSTKGQGSSSDDGSGCNASETGGYWDLYGILACICLSLIARQARKHRKGT